MDGAFFVGARLINSFLVRAILQMMSFTQAP